MSNVISCTKDPSRKKELITLLEESALGVIQPKTKKDLYRAAIKIGGNFEFSRDLKGHFSCVNAINFSNGDARLLVSGGDDKRVLIWDIYGDIENTKPKRCLKGHHGNIFCTVFDSTNRHILSCGNDRLIIYHDLEHESASKTFIGHGDAVHSVAFDPFDDNLFLSAGQDGTVRLWDVRCNVQCQGEIRDLLTQMTHAQYSPTVERQFVTSNDGGDILLRDTRMVFKSGEPNLTTYSSSRDFLKKYITTLTRNSKNVRPDVSSVTFNPSGTLLCAIINHYYPTLYNVLDEKPLCTFSSNCDSKTQAMYKNNCTFKQGYFGGPNGDYFLSGSDDFRVYVWKVPDMETMMDQRSKFTKKLDDKIYFIDDNTIIDPLSNSIPQYVLNGHRSIVNSAIWHPHIPLIFSSGVEKIIKVHSVFPFSSKDYEPKIPQQPRPRFRHGEIIFHPTDIEENMEEDLLTLKFFDFMLITDEHDDPYWGNESDNASGLSSFSLSSHSSTQNDCDENNDRENSEDDDSINMSSEYEETTSEDYDSFESDMNTDIIHHSYGSFAADSDQETETEFSEEEDDDEMNIEE